jgi:aminopeptidase 2
LGAYPSFGARIEMANTAVDSQFLPTNVKPLHYSLMLQPNFTNFTFKGLVGIDLDVCEDSKNISLHTLDIYRVGDWGANWEVIELN